MSVCTKRFVVTGNSRCLRSKLLRFVVIRDVASSSVQNRFVMSLMLEHRELPVVCGVVFCIIGFHDVVSGTVMSCLIHVVLLLRRCGDAKQCSALFYAVSLCAV